MICSRKGKLVVVCITFKGMYELWGRKNLICQMSFSNNKGLIVTPILIIAFVILFSAPVYRFVGEQNYAGAHLIFAILIIIVSATVTIQTWMFFRFTLSLHRLVIGSIFLSVTILEIFHALTYKGMPYFFFESSPYYATWFYMISRMMLAVAVLYVVTDRR